MYSEIRGDRTIRPAPGTKRLPVPGTTAIWRRLNASAGLGLGDARLVAVGPCSRVLTRGGTQPHDRRTELALGRPDLPAGHPPHHPEYDGRVSRSILQVKSGHFSSRVLKQLMARSAVVGLHPPDPSGGGLIGIAVAQGPNVGMCWDTQTLERSLLGSLMNSAPG